MSPGKARLISTANSVRHQICVSEKGEKKPARMCIICEFPYNHTMQGNRSASHFAFIVHVPSTVSLRYPSIADTPLQTAYLLNHMSVFFSTKIVQKHGHLQTLKFYCVAMEN